MRQIHDKLTVEHVITIIENWLLRGSSHDDLLAYAAMVRHFAGAIEAASRQSDREVRAQLELALGVLTERLGVDVVRAAMARGYKAGRWFNAN